MSDPLKPARYAFSHALFVRALGATALLAWLSLHVQLETLYGPEGLVPMEARLRALLERDGGAAFLSTPSVLHLLGGSLPSMHAVALSGELAALAMIFGLWPGAAALLSFVLYLSFVSLGWPFIPLQWDTLLLEALILGALLGSWRRERAATLRAPSALARGAGFFLVTRLLFASGLVKLLSGDPTWRDGTAMAFHHWTQPLPSPLAPLLFRLPSSVHTVETLATLVLEIGGPLLVFFGVRGRRTFAALVTGLMFLIALSGSYGFFNLLTVVLTIPLLDDDAFERLLPRALFTRVHPVPSRERTRVAFLGGHLVWASLQLLTSLGMPVPAALDGLYAPLARLHLAGHYGLFAVMTVDRPELTFEATEDGETWEAYDFRYKPGDPMRGPTYATPHMPRFDWMLWFAALAEPDGSIEPWIARVGRGLLEDRSETRALFGHLPLEGRRPRAVRLVRSRYRFAAEGDAAWTIEDRTVLTTWRRR